MEVAQGMSRATQDAEQAPIRFTAELSAIDGITLVTLPTSASEELPSRGQVAVRGTLDGHPFATVVEPDGRRGHWIRLDQALPDNAGIGLGDTADLTLEVVPDWPEPDVPPDLRAALDEAPARIRELWQDFTPMARWEWVRWVRATRNPATRQRRVEASVSKMDDGKRRPCCFDLSSCTDPALARSGRLRDPS
ncbi:YdeI/OmpD-associated family protein [Ornithinimicrobium sufpigmenti]|uniref:YdeI/OmpD-associated family protein n=1 Tax=Ornithinimicrobium sufpigmenti TaxID=2508882 RepID=UPI001EDD17B1|nr:MULTISPECIES: YdeI/OmpD-associated family protein [unclassified Ornithinimicrobium]